MPFKAGVWPIPKARVKLPEPATSDYIIPNNATASSSAIEETIIGSFDDGTTEDFTIYEVDPDNYVTVSLSVLDSGYYSPKKLYISINSSTGSSNYYKAGVQKSINIDPKDTTLEMAFAITNSTGTDTSARLIVEVDDGSNTTVLYDYHGQLVPTWKKISMDVSSLAGTFTLRIYFYHIYAPGVTTNISLDEIKLLRPTTPYVYDNETTAFWKPTTSNSGEWIYVDAGAPKIISGLRVYWGSNVPNAFTVEVSTDATNWTPVYKQKSPPQPNSWQEIGFYATYARYIRIYLDDQGANPVEIGEVQYYSSLVERVASEHGHGSGPEPWMRGANVRLRYVSKFANIQSRISSLQRDLQKSRTVNVKHVQELTGIVQDLKELVKLLHMS